MNSCLNIVLYIFCFYILNIYTYMCTYIHLTNIYMHIYIHTYVCVCVLVTFLTLDKIPWPKSTLREKVILAHNCREAEKVWQPEFKVGLAVGKQNEHRRWGQARKTSKLRQCTPARKATPPKYSMTFQNSANLGCWFLRVCFGFVFFFNDYEETLRPKPLKSQFIILRV